MINYQIKLQPNNNTYLVRLSFIPTQAVHVVKLPTWIPGSYMIREFSKNIVEFSAVQHKLNNNGISYEQVNKNTWHLKGLAVGQEALVNYSVYAYDFGIRAAYLDHLRGFFNNSSLCLYIEGYEELPHKIMLESIPQKWSVATGLESIGNNAYLAKNYTELIDTPFEVGILKNIEFMVGATKHYLILSGTVLENIDFVRVIGDLQKICAYQIKMFGNVAPFSEYKFLVHLGGEIYTGLEHANSAVLMVPYYVLPVTNNADESKLCDSEEYIRFLGVISHEYFHAWNVKKIKPTAFSPYDLENENYTHLLWWFEGVTSYYDDLVLYRAGIISQNKYLQLVLANINNVYKYAGVNKQSLANSSLTTWIKYYRPDENTQNAAINYYIKGAVLAMCLDLYLRDNTKTNLDAILLSLYQKWQNDKLGINEDELYGLISKYAGIDMTKWLNPYVYGCDMLPFTQLFKSFGISLIAKQELTYVANGVVLNEKKSEPKSNNTQTDIGCKLLKVEMGYKILNIYENSIAARSNLAPNDVIIAINGVKLTNWERQIALYAKLAIISLTIFRCDILLTIEVNLEASTFVNIYDLLVEDTKKLSSWLE